MGLFKTVTHAKIATSDTPRKEDKKGKKRANDTRKSFGKGFMMMTDAGVHIHETDMRAIAKQFDLGKSMRKMDVVDDFEDDIKMEPDTSVAKFEVLNKVEGALGPITALAITSTGKKVVYGTFKMPNIKKAPLFIQDMHTGLKAELYRNNMIQDLSLSQDDMEVAIVDMDGFVVIADMANAHEMYCQKVTNEQTNCISYLKFKLAGEDEITKVPNKKNSEVDSSTESPIPMKTEDAPLLTEKSPGILTPGDGNSLDPFSGNFTRVIAIGDMDGKVHVLWPALNDSDLSMAESKEAIVKEIDDRPSNAPEEKAPSDSGLAEKRCTSFKMLDESSVLVVALAKSGEAGILLAVATANQRAFVYNIQSLEAGENMDLKPLFEVNSTRGISTLCLSPDGQHFAVGTSSRLVQVIRIDRIQKRAGKRMEDDWDWEQTATFNTEEQVSSVHFSKDGSALAIGDDAANACIYCTHTGAFLHHYKRGDRIKRVMLSADGAYLAVGGFDSKVAVYNTMSGISISSSSTQPKVARSVSLSLNGQRMAVSNHAREIVVYDIHFGEVLCQFQRKEEVWVVALSDDGKLVAAAGYDGICKVYSVDRAAELSFDFRHKWFIWSVAFLHNKGVKKIAVGDWTGLVTIYRSDDGAPISSLEIPDRVFSLSITRDGNTLAVGGRNSMAAVYDISQGSPRKIHHFDREDRVYSVAISPDGTWLAAGGMDKKVGLYNLQGGLFVKSFERKGAVNYLAFSLCGKTLAAVGKDNMLTLYDMDQMAPCLCLPQVAEINAVAFSETGVLALTVGNKVVVYGKTRHSYHIRDRPNFKVCLGLLSNPEELAVLIESHPTVVNVRCPETKKSLLQVAVEQGLERTVEVLLTSSAQIGLLKDSKGDTPVSIAVKNKRKAILQMILQGVLEKRFSNLPGSLAAIIEDHIIEEIFDSEEKESMTVFNAIAQAFPDLLLYFLTQLQPEECEPQVMGHIEGAPIREPMYVALTKRVPCDLWGAFIERMLDIAEDDMYPVQCKAYRIPIKNFATAVPLAVVTKYAEKIGNFEVFAEGSVVSSIMAFKWSVLKRVFKRQFVIYLFFLICAMFWSYFITTTQKYSWVEMFEDGKGIAALVLTPIILIGSLHHLMHEISQIKDEHEDGRSYLSVMARYFSNFWNVVDLPSFLLMLITIVLFALRACELKYTCSLGILLMCLKVLFFARAFGHWGLVVRTLQKIVINVFSLFVILIVIIVGFGMAFMVLTIGDEEYANENFDDLWSAFISVTLLVYGEFSPLENELSEKNYRSITNLFIIVLFEIFTCFAVLALLNVVIANMTDSYEQVKENAALETRLELAKIIVELEKTVGFHTHPWLHTLVPLETDLQEEDIEQKTERVLGEMQNNERKMEGKLSEIMDQLHTLASKVEKLLSAKSNQDIIQPVVPLK